MTMGQRRVSLADMFTSESLDLLPGGVERRRSFFDPPEVDYATAVENDATIEEMWAKMAALGILRDE